MNKYIELPVKLLVSDGTSLQSIEIDRDDDIDMSKIQNIIAEDIRIVNNRYYILTHLNGLCRLDIYDMNLELLSQHVLLRYYAFEIYEDYIYYLTYDYELYKIDTKTNRKTLIDQYKNNLDMKIIDGDLYLALSNKLSIVSTATDKVKKTINIKGLSFYDAKNRLFIGLSSLVTVVVYKIDNGEVIKSKIEGDEHWINIAQTDGESNYYFNDMDNDHILIYNIDKNKSVVKMKDERIQNIYRFFNDNKGNLLTFVRNDMYKLDTDFNIIETYDIEQLELVGLKSAKVDIYGRILINGKDRIVIFTSDFEYYGEIKMKGIRINIQEYTREDRSKIRNIVQPIIQRYISLNIVNTITRFI